MEERLERPREQGKLLRILLGLAFLLGALLLYLTPTVGKLLWDPSMQYLLGAVKKPSTAMVVSALSSLFSLDSLPFGICSAAALVTGIALLQRSPGALRTAVISLCLQLMGIGYILVMQVVFFVALEGVLGLLLGNARYLEMAKEMCYSEPGILLHYVLMLIPSGLALLAMGALTVACFVVLKKKAPGDVLSGRMARSTTALMLLAPGIKIFLWLRSFYSAFYVSFISVSYGDAALAAASVANSINARVLNLFVGVVFVVLVVCMLLWRLRHWQWLMLLPPVLLYVLIALLGIVFAPNLCKLMSTSPELLDQAVTMIRVQLPGIAALAVLGTVWVGVSARGCIPAWVQGILLAFVGVVYVALALVSSVFLRLNIGMLLADAGVSLLVLPVVTVLGIFCRPNMKKELGNR